MVIVIMVMIMSQRKLEYYDDVTTGKLKLSANYSVMPATDHHDSNFQESR